MNIKPADSLSTTNHHNGRNNVFPTSPVLHLEPGQLRPRSEHNKLKDLLLQCLELDHLKDHRSAFNRAHYQHSRWRHRNCDNNHHKRIPKHYSIISVRNPRPNLHDSNLPDSNLHKRRQYSKQSCNLHSDSVERRIINQVQRSSYHGCGNGLPGWYVCLSIESAALGMTKEARKQGCNHDSRAGMRIITWAWAWAWVVYLSIRTPQDSSKPLK